MRNFIIVLGVLFVLNSCDEGTEYLNHVNYKGVDYRLEKAFIKKPIGVDGFLVRYTESKSDPSDRISDEGISDVFILDLLVRKIEGSDTLQSRNEFDKSINDDGCCWLRLPGEKPIVFNGLMKVEMYNEKYIEIITKLINVDDDNDYLNNDIMTKYEWIEID